MNRLMLCAVVILLTSCQNNSTEQTEDTAKDSIPVQPEIAATDREEINYLLTSVSPPVELAYIINDLDINYSTDVLHPPESAKSYGTDVKQATAIGIYSADLVYCLVNSRNDKAESYFKAIELLADKLQLTDVVNVTQLRELAAKETDPNTLAMEFTAEIEKAHRHLDKTNRLNLSALISFGSWVESIHIGSIVGKDMEVYNKDLIEVIYYESLVAKNFQKIFSKLNAIPEYESAFAHLDELNAVNNEFKVVREAIKPEITQGNDATTVVEVSTQQLTYNEGTLAKLTGQIEEIRKDLIQ